jgi:thiol-disulfide isomerase/thioredoxin
VLLDFWGTWCGPCRAAVPELKKLARELQGQPFALVGINDERDPRQVEEFAVAHEMDWPQGWDDDRRVTAALYKVRAYPTYVLIDAEGKIAHVQTGWSGRAGRDLKARIQKAIAGIPPPG